jgi:hypothetical protein
MPFSTAASVRLRKLRVTPGRLVDVVLKRILSPKKCASTSAARTIAWAGRQNLKSDFALKHAMKLSVTS